MRPEASCSATEHGRNGSGGRRDVIAQTITLSGVPSTIIGVLPQDFHFALRGDAEFWQSFHAGDGMLPPAELSQPLRSRSSEGRRLC